ncbi:MAG: sigma-70 family RNA polymerase sigma factor [Methylobacter sp.]|nr:sigma-70 family RNA polymerase sigma factor [Methylobacter sp.]
MQQLHMTASTPPDMALYWNEALADELLHFLTKRLKCPEIAADLTQETFIRFYQFVKENPPDNARALAYRIAINLANDYQRKIKVRERFNAEMPADFHADDYPNETPGPEQTVFAQQRLYILQTALDELPEDCRNAFLLHSIEGLTGPEIAARLGVSNIKVYRLLVKATAHCELRLDDAE